MDKQRVNLFSLFAVLLRGRDPARCYCVMVVIAGAATGIVAVMGKPGETGQQWGNRVLINHLADRVLQQDHGTDQGTRFDMQLNTIRK